MIQMFYQLKLTIETKKYRICCQIPIRSSLDSHRYSNSWAANYELSP